MGRVGAPHGVHGAFRVRPVSADPASLLAQFEQTQKMMKMVSKGPQKMMRGLRNMMMGR